MESTSNSTEITRTRIAIKRFILRIIFLVLPLPVLFLIEAMFLPLDTFAFRNWEALSVRKLKWAFPGPFYPNRKIERIEIGDLGNGTPYAVSRPVVWVTDDYGFRNRLTRGPRELDLVIVGDSFVSGTGLSQDDLLPEVLERNYGLRSTGFGPSNFKSFTSDPRFRSQLPKVVIVAVAERSLLRLTETHGSNTTIRQWAGQLGTRHEALLCGIDRMIAPQLFCFLQARLRPEPRRAVSAQNRPELLLIADHKSAEAIRPQFRQTILKRIQQYHSYVTERGSNFLFVAIPDKEYCHEEMLPDRNWPSLLPDLVESLRNEGITVIDLARLFKETIAADPSLALYQSDDSHWSADGVRIAAEQIAAVLRSTSGSPDPPLRANRDDDIRTRNVRR